MRGRGIGGGAASRGSSARSRASVNSSKNKPIGE